MMLIGLAGCVTTGEATVFATQANLQNATNLLAANFMRGWFEISVNQQLLDIEQRCLAVLENNETLALKRYQGTNPYLPA